MRAIIGALCLALGSGSVAYAAAAKDGVMAPIHQFIDSFNRGDIKAAEAAHAASVSIIDEMPPHAWQGPGAFQAWLADLGKDAKAAGDTDQIVTLGRATRTRVDGDTAYVIVPAVYTYKEHGKRMVEPAQMAFALHSEAAGWKIASWTWVGTTPHPAAVKTKPKPKPKPTQ